MLLKNEGSLLPLQNKKINLFGWASTAPAYGGSGSGSISASYPNVSLIDGLTNAGIEVNEELTQFYTDFLPERPAAATWNNGLVFDFSLPEPEASTYSDELLANAKAFSDVAVIVISRLGGEEIDLPVDMDDANYTNNSESYDDFAPGEHYLQLSQTEEDLVNLVCQNFNNVVVIYNGASTLELGFAEEHEQIIKSVIWCPYTGQSGVNALGEIMTGAVNPSGKTTDTFVYDLTNTPSATGVLAMRNACKNILYTVVNSRAYDTDSAMSMENWQIALIVVDCIVAAVVIGAEVLTVRGYKKRKNPAV